MNKYVLLAPLMVFSFLLGYCASTAQEEQVYAVTIIAAVYLVAVGIVILKVSPKQEV
jgi:hypothetical protein